MRIIVAQRHIDAGRMCNGLKCPVALALAEAGVHDPCVSPTYIHTHWNSSDRRVLALTPDVVARWIRRFDDGIHTAEPPSEPFEFDIEVHQ